MKILVSLVVVFVLVRRVYNYCLFSDFDYVQLFDQFAKVTAQMLAEPTTTKIVATRTLNYKYWIKFMSYMSS